MIAEAAPELDHLHADVARGGATSSYKYSAGRLGELMRLLTQRDSSSIWASHKSRSHARLIEAAAVTLGRRKGRRSGSVQAVVCRVPVSGGILLLMDPLLTWLIQGAIGPALMALPVDMAGEDLADAARRWFRRLRGSDGLSRIVRAATGDNVNLSRAEFVQVRDLLERQDTWVLVGRGTVDELASRIASCMPGREREDSLAAGRAIAGGLLEFAVRDLEPDWFRQVLFARVERLQADQASALDQAMLSVHADLAALFAVQDAADADRFARLMSQLTRVIDLYPSRSADQGELAVYLAVLIAWLNSDPWPQDARFDGPTLTPAAIERKLRIASVRNQHEQDLDVDDLATRCTRLVLLGGPGSGKTWLAKRTARLSAEAALEALGAGARPDEIELPLYTTCAMEA